MITLGEGSYNPRGDIDCYEGVNFVAGKYCSIASGLKIYSGTHPCTQFREVVSQYPFQAQFNWDYPPCKTHGFVTIGNDVWISTDVAILEGITIGDGAIIGARAMVTKDVPAYAFVAGNPARIKSYRFSEEVIEKLLKIKWWDWEKSKIEIAMPYMKDVAKFLEVYDN